MTLKYCQGPACHQYTTQDRLKGQAGNKTYQTRRRSRMYYGKGNFCDRRCMEDWVAQYVEQALDHFGRTTQAKHLTEENAWIKDYDWRVDDEQNKYINTLYSIVDKLEKRIATLEKVLQSHAKVIGEIREDKDESKI